MDDPNMTMEEYIKFEEEKARRHGRVFNWQTATYGKVRVDDDLYDLRSVEAEFPAIVIDDTVTPQDALPCKSQVSTLVNDEIDFRISFDESDDEDYTIICDLNSFSYKMIFVNNLKTDSENDNEKASIPSFLPPKPMTSYIDDLDFFNDFENEFPAIIYNDAQTMLLCFIMNLYVPFGIPFDPKRYYKDGDYAIMLRRPRYQGLEYTDKDIVDFEERMSMEHRDDAGVVVFTSLAWGRLFVTRGPLFQLGGAKRRLSWRQFILALGLHTEEEMESLGFARYWSESKRMIPGKGNLHVYWRDISIDGDFLGPPSSYTLIRDPNYLKEQTLWKLKMTEQDIPPPTITAMKIPIIRKGEYDIWSMRMRQYICHIDHNLWDVIVNGDLEEEPAPTSGETSAPPAPKIAKQLATKRN
ncbi:hypothetical protein Tco_0893161 [Tanacetum coccineum]|uniref:Uncharacterized protein n=1 Tax=Tanacetum coccineum TaxID=301880 RepID=A0ABQ5C9I8_9ASTR